MNIVVCKSTGNLQHPTLAYFAMSTVKAASKTLTLPTPGGAVPISEEQWREFIGSEFEDQHHEMKVVGAWSVPVKAKALAVSYTWRKSFTDTITLYGKRTLSKLRGSGCDMAGVVSVNNKKVRGFTSSQLFQLPDGRLFDVAVIYVCTQEPDIIL